MPNRRHAGITMNYLQPLIQQRIDDMNRKKIDPNFVWEEPVRLSADFPNGLTLTKYV